MSILHGKDLHEHAHGPGSTCTVDHGKQGDEHVHSSGCSHSRNNEISHNLTT